MTNELTKYIKLLIDYENLDQNQAARAMQIILQGGGTPAQAAVFAIALRMKGETVNEITGIIEAISAKYKPAKLDNILSLRCIGSRHNYPNIILPVGIILASCGIKVIDHGLKSSANDATADLLSSLGLNIDLQVKQAEEILQSTNYCFARELQYLPQIFIKELVSMRHELGGYTIFNNILPILAPVQAEFYLLGVPEQRLRLLFAEVLQALKIKKAWIFCSEDGMDKLSLTTKTSVTEVNDDQIQELVIQPAELGLVYSQDQWDQFTKNKTIRGNSEQLLQLLHSEPGIYQDIVALHAAAGLYLYNQVPDLLSGIEKTKQVLANGDANSMLKQIVSIVNQKAIKD